MRRDLRGMVYSAILCSFFASGSHAAEEQAWWRSLAPLVTARVPAGATAQPSDFETPEYHANWGLAQIDAAEAYAQGFTGKGVVVAVIDTGLDLDHSEFAGRISEQAFNTGSDQPASDASDIAWHGTHVAGTIGAARDGQGMQGVAYEATLLPIRAVEVPDGDELLALRYAADQGVDVLNGSFGTPAIPPKEIEDPDDPGFWIPNPTYQPMTANLIFADYIEQEADALRAAAAADVLMVFSAGNNFLDQPGASANPSSLGLLPAIRPENHGSGAYVMVEDNDNFDYLDPATFDYVDGNDPRFAELDFSDLEGSLLVVVALGSNGQIASYSNRCGLTATWCLAAPGGDLPADGQTRAEALIYSTSSDGGYRLAAGTSMAAPHVAGVAALVRGAFPYMTARQAIQVLLTTATDLGDPEIYGQGLVDAGKAVRGPGAFAMDWDVDTQGYNSTWSNDIDGEGGLTKRGEGLLRLTGENSYGGATAVEGGLLAVEGSIASPVTVGQDGGLSGSGRIEGAVTVAGLLLPGTVVPGEGLLPGTLVVTGPVELAPSATFAALLDIQDTGTTGAQLLLLGPLGSFRADGTLALGLASLIDGSDARSLIPLIGRRAGLVSAEQGVEGSFDRLDAPLPEALRFDLIYETASIDAVVTPALYARLDSLGQALSDNQSSVARAVDQVRQAAGTRLEGEDKRFFDSLYELSLAALPDSFDSLSGQIYGDAIIADLANRRLVRGRLYNRLEGGGTGAAPAVQLSSSGGLDLVDQTAAAPPADPEAWRIWGEGLYAFGHTAGDGNALAVDRDSGGLLLGLDRDFGPAILGLAFGYLHSYGSLQEGPGASFDIDSYYVGLYGRLTQGPLVLDATLGTAFNRYDIDRNLSVGRLQESAGGSAWGVDFSASALAGYRLEAGRVELLPQVGLDYDRIQRDALDESGAGALSLSVDAETFNALRSLVGGRVRVPLAPRLPQAPLLDFRAYWSHDFADVVAETDALLLGVPIQASTAEVSRDAAVLGVALKGTISPGIELSLGFSSELRRNQNDQAVNAGLRIAF